MRSRVANGTPASSAHARAPPKSAVSPTEEGPHGDGLDPEGGRREPRHPLGQIRIGPITAEDEFHATRRDHVVVDDQLVFDPDQVEHQGGQHPRAVLTRRAVEDERQPGGSPMRSRASTSDCRPTSRYQR